MIEDIPPGWEQKVPRVHRARCRSRIDQYEALLDRNEIFLQRTKGTGDRVGGAAARAGRHRARCCARPGNPWDLRKADALLARTTTSTSRSRSARVGDHYDRYRVRIAEMRESLRIIEQALDGLPEGPYITDEPQGRAAAAARARHLDGGADPPLQARHRGLPRAARRGLRARSSRPRGELGCFVLADGSAKPARVHMRDPSLRATCSRCRDMAAGTLIADLIAIRRDAGSDSGRDRPMSASGRVASCAGDRSCGRRSRTSRSHQLRERPGLTTGCRFASRPDEGRPLVPDPADVDVPAELRREIEDHMAQYPDRHSAALPALRPRSGCTAGARREAILQVAAVMQVTPAYLSIVATFYDMLEHRAGRRAATSTSARTSRCMLRDAQAVLDALCEEARDAGPRGREHPRVRVPRRLRHGADGVDRRPLRRPARRPRRGAPSIVRRAARQGRRGRCPEPRLVGRRRAPGCHGEDRRRCMSRARSSSSTSTSRA